MNKCTRGTITVTNTICMVRRLAKMKKPQTTEANVPHGRRKSGPNGWREDRKLRRQRKNKRPTFLLEKSLYLNVVATAWKIDDYFWLY